MIHVNLIPEGRFVVDALVEYAFDALVTTGNQSGLVVSNARAGLVQYLVCALATLFKRGALSFFGALDHLEACVLRLFSEYSLVALRP